MFDIVTARGTAKVNFLFKRKIDGAVGVGIKIKNEGMHFATASRREDGRKVARGESIGNDARDGVRICCS